MRVIVTASSVIKRPVQFPIQRAGSERTVQETLYIVNRRQDDPVNEIVLGIAIDAQMFFRVVQCQHLSRRRDHYLKGGEFMAVVMIPMSSVVLVTPTHGGYAGGA